MLIDNLNLNNLRVFESVYRKRCMTTAAKELHLTQSGVSQHIKSLEEGLGVTLFDRINKNIIPTDAGERLFKSVSKSLSSIERTVAAISQRDSEIKSVVRIGMPIEFGNHVIIPKLAEIGKQYPGLRFDMLLDFASKMEGPLVNGDLDFAFIDEYSMDKKIVTEDVAEEVIELCASKEYMKQHPPVSYTKSYFESLDYIVYQDGEPIVRRWLSHHLKRRNMKLNVRAQVMDVRAIARYVTCGMGVGVIPNFLLQTIESEGYELFRFQGKGKALTNKIQLAYLRNRTHRSSTQIVIDALREKLK
ncbi:MAG: LysR family transcriptional regulator [Bdellovibrionales bacterium]|nr:LysR family transcriptional regulator [Bdellovibrionales bacterium]